MTKKESRKQTSIITGIPCPNCGKSRALRTERTDELRCSLCGHVWTPGKSTD